MSVFDVDKVIADGNVRKFCSGGSGQCTGIVNRAIPATGMGAPGARGPQDVGIWVHGAGSSHYQEVDPKTVVANPQLGDILIYRNPNGGATWSHSGPGYSAGDRIGHTVMWLPWPHNPSNITWICDHEQSHKSPTWWTYGGTTQFDCMKAFRVRGQISYNGKTFQSSTLPELPDSGPYKGGLAGNKDELQSATSSTGDGSGLISGATSTGGGGGGSYNIYGANYGIRKIDDSGEPNTVYQLASMGERNNVLLQSQDRKKQFKSMLDEMKNQVPNRGREIITSPEMYDNSILKTTQSSKQERKTKK